MSDLHDEMAVWRKHLAAERIADKIVRTKGR
jgi:hypothetical protein